MKFETRQLKQRELIEHGKLRVLFSNGGEKGKTKKYLHVEDEIKSENDLKSLESATAPFFTVDDDVTLLVASRATFLYT